VLPYAQQYYKHGLTVSTDLTDSFNDLCEENDKMKDFINRYYEVTDNPKDKVHKDIFLEHYRMVTNLKLVSWQNILNDVKRLGLNYQKNLSSGGLQGCLIGIKEKTLEPEQDDFAEEETIEIKPKQTMQNGGSVYNDFEIETETPRLKTVTVKPKKTKIVKDESIDLVLDSFDD